MKKTDPAESDLRRLRELSEVDDIAVVAELRRLLGKGDARVVARAARLAAERSLADLGGDLAKAFVRFMRNPGKTDPGCLTKLALIDALHALDWEDDVLFLQGLHHVQMEPVWGKSIDTAADLRGACANALAQRAYPEILPELVTLLVDSEPPARRAAIRALATIGNEAAQMLLRLKALTGDPEPDVVGACFSGLMQAAPERSLEFVRGFLDSEDDFIAESAALALGEARTESALRVLFDCWDTHVDARVRRMLVLPIALSRREEALAFLLDLIRNGGDAYAQAAVEALGIFRADARRVAEIRDAVDEHGDRTLARVFNKVMASTSDGDSDGVE